MGLFENIKTAYDKHGADTISVRSNKDGYNPYTSSAPERFAVECTECFSIENRYEEFEKAQLEMVIHVLHHRIETLEDKIDELWHPRLA